MLNFVRMSKLFQFDKNEILYMYVTQEANWRMATYAIETASSGVKEDAERVVVSTEVSPL